jgi:hypothetical protein
MLDPKVASFKYGIQTRNRRTVGEKLFQALLFLLKRSYSLSEIVKKKIVFSPLLDHSYVIKYYWGKIYDVKGKLYFE